MHNLKKSKIIHMASEVCDDNLKREYPKDYGSSEVVGVWAVTSSWREIKIVLFKKRNIFFMSIIINWKEFTEQNDIIHYNLYHSNWIIETWGNICIWSRKNKEQKQK